MIYRVPDPKGKTKCKAQMGPGLWVALRKKNGSGPKRGWHIRVLDMNGGGKHAWIPITNARTIERLEKAYP
jgi:hypothetical protein